MDKMTNFKNAFNVQNSKICNNEIKIIIGQEPYKQKLGKINFKVPSPDLPVYKDFSEVAFLVSQWIKIQDSLEMIFNLLFTKEKSIAVLSYLKTFKISATDFAQFLYNEFNIILINRYDSNGHDHKNDIEKLINLLNKEKKDIYILFVGEKAPFKSKSLQNVNTAKIIHPSGVNLNNFSERYYKSWYTLQDSSLRDRRLNFTLKKFMIL